MSGVSRHFHRHSRSKGIVLLRFLFFILVFILIPSLAFPFSG